MADLVGLIFNSIRISLSFLFSLAVLGRQLSSEESTKVDEVKNQILILSLNNHSLGVFLLFILLRLSLAYFSNCDSPAGNVCNWPFHQTT